MNRIATALFALTLATPAMAQPRHNPGGGQPGGHHPMSLEEMIQREQELLDFVLEHDQEKYEYLVQLKENNPQAYKVNMQGVARFVEQAQGDPGFVERAKRMRDLKAFLETATGDYDALSKAEQKDRKAEITAAVEELFDLRQEERHAKVAEIERKLEELELEIQDRDQNRKSIVNDFVEQIITGPVEL